MKKTLLLLLSLFILANTVTPNSVQAYSWQQAKGHAIKTLAIIGATTCAVAAIKYIPGLKEIPQLIISQFPRMRNLQINFCSNGHQVNFPFTSRRTQVNLWPFFQLNY